MNDHTRWGSKEPPLYSLYNIPGVVLWDGLKIYAVSKHGPCTNTTSTIESLALNALNNQFMHHRETRSNPSRVVRFSVVKSINGLSVGANKYRKCASYSRIRACCCDDGRCYGDTLALWDVIAGQSRVARPAPGACSATRDRPVMRCSIVTIQLCRYMGEGTFEVMVG